MKIYTRTGDRGQTSLADGTRVLKSDTRINTIGAIDELNSTIGVALVYLNPSKFKKIKKVLLKIQNDLFEIGAYLAAPNALPLSELANRALEFENLIDTLTASLPPLKNFILPGGGKTGSWFHICRTQTRRAERRLVRLIQHEKIDNSIMIYLNRLSDLFFTLARFVNHTEKKKETIWLKR